MSMVVNSYKHKNVGGQIERRFFRPSDLTTEIAEKWA